MGLKGLQFYSFLQPVKKDMKRITRKIWWQFIYHLIKHVFLEECYQINSEKTKCNLLFCHFGYQNPLSNPLLSLYKLDERTALEAQKINTCCVKIVALKWRISQPHCSISENDTSAFQFSTSEQLLSSSMELLFLLWWFWVEQHTQPRISSNILVISGMLAFS